MNKMVLLILSIFIAQMAISASFGELQKIPHDSANSENMRIWIPVELPKCQVKVTILDTNMKQVRLLVDKVVTSGYYNIFWDKKDDSGDFVEAGTYKVAIISGTFKRITGIIVTYANGENSAILSTSEDMKNPFIAVKLLKDSLYISLDILNIRENLSDPLFVDSLIVGDSATFSWEPDSTIPTGRYFYKIKVNEFEHLIEFRYKK